MQSPVKVKVDPKLKKQKYISYGLDPGTPPGPRSGFAGSGLFPNKEWEDLCFRCYDEGELLMCDFRTCPKVCDNESIGYPNYFSSNIQGGAGGRGLGLVDLDSGHSTTCLVVLGQMGVCAD